MKKNDNNSSIIIIGLFFLVVLVKIITEPSASEKWYQDYKEAFDTYNENHKDDWSDMVMTQTNRVTFAMF